VGKKDSTAVVRIGERLHLRLPDHEAHLLLVGRGIGANPGRQWFGHDERKEVCDIFSLDLTDLCPLELDARSSVDRGALKFDLIRFPLGLD
jgi:hypothetical protein